jgi:hypothetical protein
MNKKRSAAFSALTSQQLHIPARSAPATKKVVDIFVDDRMRRESSEVNSL